jgi:hypothetical protein
MLRYSKDQGKSNEDLIQNNFSEEEVLMPMMEPKVHVKNIQFEGEIHPPNVVYTNHGSSHQTNYNDVLKFFNLLEILKA